MADHSAIEWTDASWNVITGCDRVSAGCDHCYIERTIPFRVEGRRFDDQGRMGIRLHPDRLDWPLRWRRPRMIFTPSLGDLFHPEVPDEFIYSVWAKMSVTPRHTYQVLTKRPQRMASWMTAAVERSGRGPMCVLPNVWLGTSIELDKYAWRADHVRATPAAVRWLSLEPLLGPLPTLDLTGIDWVVVGGESGPRARPMEVSWAEAIVEQCRAEGVPTFVKQLGSVLGGRSHHDIAEFPESLRVREYPVAEASPSGRLGGVDVR